MTTLFFKIAKNLLLLSLLISSSTSWATTWTFNLLNSGDSVKNPITITDASILANDQPNGYPVGSPECTFTKPFSNVQVTTGQETFLTYETPPNIPTSCFQSYGMQAILNIQGVDGKGNNGSCTLYKDQIRDPSASVYAGAIKIIETNNRFYCEFPVSMAKK